jgi:hypothetical protein
MLSQDAGISDGNVVERMNTVFEDVFFIENYLAEV